MICRWMPPWYGRVMFERRRRVATRRVDRVLGGDPTLSEAFARARAAGLKLEFRVQPADAPAEQVDEVPEVATPNGTGYVACPTCEGSPKRPSTRQEGGSLSCKWCNRTQTFNFMRDRGTNCTCRAAREESCPTCLGAGVVVEV